MQNGISTRVVSVFKDTLILSRPRVIKSSVGVENKTQI